MLRLKRQHSSSCINLGWTQGEKYTLLTKPKKCFPDAPRGSTGTPSELGQRQAACHFHRWRGRRSRKRRQRRTSASLQELGFWDPAAPAVGPSGAAAFGHEVVGNGPSLMASDSLNQLPVLYYIQYRTYISVQFKKKKKDGVEKRMPAEFFPLKLIFYRCVFSVSIMTAYLGTALQAYRTTAVSVGVEHSWARGEHTCAAVYLFIECYSLAPKPPDV